MTEDRYNMAMRARQALRDLFILYCTEEKVHELKEGDVLLEFARFAIWMRTFLVNAKSDLVDAPDVLAALVRRILPELPQFCWVYDDVAYRLRGNTPPTTPSYVVTYDSRDGRGDSKGGRP